MQARMFRRSYNAASYLKRCFGMRDPRNKKMTILSERLRERLSRRATAGEGE